MTPSLTHSCGAPSRRMGILTFHRTHNFGAVLQAYALQHLLTQENPGAEVTILDVVPPFMDIPDAPWYKFRKRAQQEAFRRFREGCLPISGPQDASPAKLCRELGLDTLVVGSDQVWNPDLTRDAWKNYFLEGVPDTVRACSYAASFGEGSDRQFAPEIQEAMGALLQRFHRISVREESGREICRRLGRDDAVRVLDPVLAAPPALFQPLLKEAGPVRPAITAVLLDETPAHRTLLRHLGKATGEPARIIAVRQRRLPTLGIQRPFATTIPDYLASLQKAPLVVTDSFHAVMFSLVFQRPFLVTPSTRNHRFDRIADVLSLLGLQDRIVKPEEWEMASLRLDSPMDYRDIQERLEPLRRQSLAFLASL